MKSRQFAIAQEKPDLLGRIAVAGKVVKREFVSGVIQKATETGPLFLELALQISTRTTKLCGSCRNVTNANGQLPLHPQPH